MKPKSSEPHEVIIELSEEVDYLVKRLTKLKAQGLLTSDIDYLNAIYTKMPTTTQELWDHFDVKKHSS